MFPKCDILENEEGGAVYSCRLIKLEQTRIPLEVAVLMLILRPPPLVLPLCFPLSSQFS